MPLEECGHEVQLPQAAVAAAIVGGVLAVSGTAAFAYWTASGSGSGTASTASTTSTAGTAALTNLPSTSQDSCNAGKADQWH